MKPVGLNAVDNKIFDNKEKDAVMLYNIEPIISTGKIEKSTSATTNKENDSWVKVYRINLCN